MTAGAWGRPVALYDRFEDKVPKVPAFEGGDLVDLLTSHADPGCRVGDSPGSLPPCAGRKCPAKNSTCWSPVTFKEGAAWCEDEGVESVNYAVFDLDHMAPGQVDAALAAAAEYEYVLHSTHSHGPGDECYRVAFPLDRPCPVADWPRAHAGIVAALGLPCDPTCGNPSRIYAVPIARAGVDPVARHHAGEPVSVDDALAAGEAAGAAPTKEVTSPTSQVVAPAGPIDLAALREALAAARRSKASQRTDTAREQAAILGRVLDGEALGRPGELHRARVKLCGLLAYWLPAATPWEAALEILRPTLVATPIADGETFDSIVEKTRRLYEESVRSRAASDERKAAERAAFRALADSVKARSSIAPVDVVDPSNPDAWVDLLLTNRDGVRACEHNAKTLLTFADELRGAFRWNVLKRRVEVVSGPFAGASENTLSVDLAAWLQLHCKFQGGEGLVGKVLLSVARANSYDPVAEYLGEIVWDGQRRIDGFLETYLGVTEGDPAYVRAVSRKWLIALVARAMSPGAQVDNVLILEGPQGVGKSSAFRAIAGGPEFFLDTPLDLGDKDALQMISGAWVVELAELASIRRAEVERVRQFITSRVDKFRPPYGRVVEDSPRRCVIVGSTNDSDYLRDHAGNRRYWPVRVGRIDVDAIARDRDLLFAEAVAAFRAGDLWYLVGDEVALAAREAEERVVESSVEEAVERWWSALPAARRPRRVSILEVAEAALGASPERASDHGLRTDIGHAMVRLGFRRGRRTVDGRRDRHYEASAELMAVAVRPTYAQSRTLDLVRAVKERASKTTEETK